MFGALRFGSFWFCVSDERENLFDGSGRRALSLSKITFQYL